MRTASDMLQTFGGVFLGIAIADDLPTVMMFAALGLVIVGRYARRWAEGFEP